jgi:hypothetical protein
MDNVAAHRIDNTKDIWTAQEIDKAIDISLEGASSSVNVAAVADELRRPKFAAGWPLAL